MKSNNWRADGQVATLPDFPWSPRLRVAFALYQVVLHLALPALVALLLIRSRREPLYRANLGQRFGRVRPITDGRVLVFAASLGETRAASRVVQGLLDQGVDILLTHSSPAGLDAGQKMFADAIASGRVVQSYHPGDFFWAVRRFLRDHNPRLGVVVEAELWPGLMAEAARREIPMVQINGNYTERAFRRDSGPFGLMRGAFWKFYSRIITKSEERADRYRRAGVDADRISIVGELKFDLPIRDDMLAAARSAKKQLGPRRALTIASSIEAEEDDLMTVVKRVRADVSPPPLVVWVPRSPQRFNAVFDALRHQGLRCVRRTDAFDDALRPTADLETTDVLIGDSIGEMDFYYALADIVFVGATLAPMGGHNIIEPLALKRPVITGPSLYGIAYPAYDAIEAGALIAADDADQLATVAAAHFNDADRYAAFQGRTEGFNDRHKGASDRTVALLMRHLGGEP